MTRDCAKRMHYAAWRSAWATDEMKRGFWKPAYLSFRDRVVLGNRKMVYRAVCRWGASAGLAADLISDCHLVLIQAVAAYNPWMGIRFSTYGFTCLMRVLSRLSPAQPCSGRASKAAPLGMASFLRRTVQHVQSGQYLGLAGQG